jgi:NADPH:quinone reductase-like Zn-dependent oxidoreductase
MPDFMSFEEAASLPIAYCTAYHSIKTANLCKGESVLIHAASGGLGQALLMLCQYMGANIFTTVGTAEKKAFIMDKFGIPESHIFNSRDESFAACVLGSTNNRGVDVIFNSLSSELLRVTWNCIAPFGRFIELGKRDLAINSRLEMAPFTRNVSFAAVDIMAVLKEKPAYGARLWREVMSLIRDGKLRAPGPISIYGMAEIEKALRIMQGGRHIGKLVAVPRAEETSLVSLNLTTLPSEKGHPANSEC